MGFNSYKCNITIHSSQVSNTRQTKCYVLVYFLFAITQICYTTTHPVETWLKTLQLTIQCILPHSLAALLLTLYLRISIWIYLKQDSQFSPYNNRVDYLSELNCRYKCVVMSKDKQYGILCEITKSMTDLRNRFILSWLPYVTALTIQHLNIINFGYIIQTLAFKTGFILN